MLKKYSLEVFIDEDHLDIEGIHEKFDNLSLNDIRLLISALEEYKTRLIANLIARQVAQATNAKKMD